MSEQFSLPNFLEVLPNRVRRNYTGGALLDRWSTQTISIDGDKPEDWIASTVSAINPGLSPIDCEGLTKVKKSNTGESGYLKDVFLENPHYYLGERHIQLKGLELGFLAKLLDSAIRLHVQAHPTAKFSQSHLNSPYGKFETYVILAIRENASPYLRLGFQRAPSKKEWKRIIEEQDIKSMDACFDPIPLKVGEVWYVPGGMPHAIGEGVLMLEVMEPSDWVVRCEFNRNGIIVPPEARFMKRGLDFCLDIFDYKSRNIDEIRNDYCVTPKLIHKSEGFCEEELIGSSQTNCFTIHRLTINAPLEVSGNGSVSFLLVSQGSGTLDASDGALPLHQSSRVILPAQASCVKLSPSPKKSLEVLICKPQL